MSCNRDSFVWACLFIEFSIIPLNFVVKWSFYAVVFWRARMLFFKLFLLHFYCYCDNTSVLIHCGDHISFFLKLKWVKISTFTSDIAVLSTVHSFFPLSLNCFHFQFSFPNLWTEGFFPSLLAHVVDLFLLLSLFLGNSKLVNHVEVNSTLYLRL